MGAPKGISQLRNCSDNAEASSEWGVGGSTNTSARSEEVFRYVAKGLRYIAKFSPRTNTQMLLIAFGTYGEGLMVCRP